MSTSGRIDERAQKEQQQQQQEATIRSIDETKDNVRKAIEGARRETPRFAQTVAEFQNETADVTREISDTFLDTQKDIIISIQSVWADLSDKAGYYSMPWMRPWNYYWWMTGGGFVSPIAMANLYARAVAYMTANFETNTKMATNMMFAGLEAARASARYARENAKEMSRMVSINVREISRTSTRESVVVQGEAASSSSSARITSSTNTTEAGSGREDTGGTARRK
jgi:hypothetical protein